MNAAALIESVRASGGTLALVGDSVRCWLPEDAAHLAGELRQCKAELMELLRRVGGRVAEFPHCPRCASYALYRENNLGNYECQSCGLQDIEEEIARRLM
jgi:Zn ribbon nucleic-acid-binding protein